MIKGLTDEQKSYFYKGGYFRYYKFYFPEIDLTLTDENIVSESVKLHEAITDGQEFELGGCIASSIEFQIYDEVLEDINGLLFYATLEVKDTDVSIPMGTYRVDSVKMEDDLEYKTVVAYDALYDISADVSKWYEDLFKSHTEISLKAFRESLLDYLEVPYETQDIINDGVKIKKTLETQSGLSGTEFLRMCCIINGGFGKIDRYGYFTIQGVGTLALYPEETLFPSDDLFPEDSVSYIGGGEDGIDAPEYYKCQYEEYMVQKITSVNIQTENSDVAVESEIDQSNPYLISGNYLLYGKSTSELKAIGHEIYSAIANTQYRPCAVDLDGVPYLETGDSFALSKKGQPVESIIFSRTLSGVQGLKDNFESQGNEIRANEVSVSQEIQTLKGKTLRIDKTVEGVSSELTNFETNTSSKFEQTDREISLRVTKDGLINEINVSDEAIELKGNRLIVESDNFNLDENGNATFSGKLSGVSGKISNFDITANGLEWNRNGSTGTKIWSNTIYVDAIAKTKSSVAFIGINDNVRMLGNLDVEGSTSGIKSSDITVVETSAGNINFSGSLNAASVSWCNGRFQLKSDSDSDIRLKKDIKDLGVEEVKKIYDDLKPIQYRYITEETNENIRYGLSANEVIRTYEDLGYNWKDYDLVEEVENTKYGSENKYTDKTHYALNYQNLHALHILMIQNLSDENKALRNEICDLRDRLTKLEREVFKS